MRMRRSLSIALMLCLVASAFSFATTYARAAEGGTDVAGYYWTDNNSPDPRVDYNWVEVSSTGTDTGIIGDDNNQGPFPIGFSFKFYENTYTEFYASSNGLVTFGSGSSDYSNDAIPSISSPNNLIAPFWDDLCVSYSVYNSGRVYYETVGVAPARQLVVEWHEVSELGSYDLMTFEVILNETGEIWMQYQTLSGSTGRWATVGIEDSDGMIGCQYSYNSAVLSDGLAIMFEKAPFGFGPAQTQVVDAGTTAYFTLHLTNNQEMADSFDITTTSINGWAVSLYDSTWSPLVDNNANGAPDTGDVAPDAVATIYVGVEVPSSPTSPYDVVGVWAQSFADPSLQREVPLRVDVVPAEFTPPHSDYGVDDDSDMTYDRLVVDVALDVVIEDDYYFYGDLYDSSWDYVVSATPLAVHLSQGTQTVSVSYDGEGINGHSVNGPYYADIYMYNSTYYWSDVGSHTTAAYLWSEFDSPAVKFSPPHADMALDTDSDGLYNSLVVLVTVEVNVAGTYTIEADLYDLSWWYVADAENETYLDVGTHDVWVFFNGWEIRQSGLNGPYIAYMHLLDSWNYYGDDEHTTAAYTWDEFQILAVFSPPHSDYGLDSDSDGLYNYLAVDVEVIVYVAGDFEVGAYLYSPSSWYELYTGNDTYLDVGLHTVQLLFDGWTIRGWGESGSFGVDLNLYNSSFASWLDYDWYMTASYSWDEFQPLAVFSPPHTDSGLDSDSNGLYDYLVVTGNVTVSVEGWYHIYAELYSSGWYIAHVYGMAYLDVGEGSIELQFLGFEIRNSEYNGPYTVEMWLYDDWWDLHDFDSHTTQAYLATEFEGVPCELAPPYSDYGRDDDEDGLYDYLVVEIPVDVHEEGDYRLSASLWTSGMSSYIDGYTEYFSATPGTTVIEMEYFAWEIQDSGEDGPYEVAIYLYDGLWNQVDYDTHTTDVYTLDMFASRPAEFSPPHSDYGLDTDDDMLYDYLAVDVEVLVAVAGYYVIEAELDSPSWSYWTYAEVATFLGEGLQTVQVLFDGWTIRAWGESGNFDVYLSIYNSMVGDMWVDSDWHETAWYSWDEFQTPPAELSPPHSDYGLDSDTDGLYDYLVVEVHVDVAVEGVYEVAGDLYDWWGGWICDTENTTYLEAGLQTVNLMFPGWIIRVHLAESPFEVVINLNTEQGSWLDYDSHTTGWYAYDSFETPPASFSPPHSDWGVDEDDDSSYESLIVNASLDVEIADEYIIEAELYSSSWDLLDMDLVVVYLEPGQQNVSLEFPGWIIASYGMDGPYEVDMWLYTEEDGLMDFDSYDTGVYLVGDFNSTMPMIVSSWAEAAPSVDGLVSAGEWASATAVDFVDADDMNELDATMYVMNNATHLFICYDVVGDTDSDPEDSAAVSFDTDNDGAPTDGHDDQFSIGGLGWIPGAELHEVYDETADEWIEHCAPFDENEPGHAGLASAIGFGASPASSVPHRMFELSIPLELLGASVGDVLGFAALSEESAGVWDESAWEYSTWPAFVYYVPPLTFYGDLKISAEPVETVASLAGTAGLAGWFLSGVTVTLETSGGEGGLDYTMYRVDGGTWQAYDAPFVVSGNGVHAVEFYSVDIAGNTEATKSVAVRIDGASPASSSTVSGDAGEEGWYTGEVTVELSAQDNSGGSGVSALRYRVDSGSWVTYTGEFVLDADGTHLVEYYAEDAAGNDESTQSLTVKIDSTPPETTADVDGSTVTLTALDATSGVNVTIYRIDDGEWAVYAGAFEVTGSGNHTVEFYSVDNAGNAEAARLTYVDNGGGGGTVFGVDWWVIVLVLLIIALLVAIAVPMIFGMRRRAREAESRAAIKDMGTAVAQLQDDYQPTRTQDLLTPEEPPPPPEEEK